MENNYYTKKIPFKKEKFLIIIIIIINIIIILAVLFQDLPEELKKTWESLSGEWSVPVFIACSCHTPRCSEVCPLFIYTVVGLHLPAYDPPLSY